MSTGGQAGDTNYGLPSRILAAILSPWLLILVTIGIFALVYFVYYRPRLFYTYKSFPKSPRIYILPPFFRRRQYLRDPLAYLSAARNVLEHAPLFWTDVIPGLDTKVITLLNDSSLITQFLGTDDKDSLSWDAPLRSAWDNLFERTSSYGKRPQFYNAARHCLSHGFSPAKMTTTSNYHQVIQRCAHIALEKSVSGNLMEIVEAATFNSLLTILYGDIPDLQFHTIMRNILDELKLGRKRSKQCRLLGARYHSHLSAIIDNRLNDLEQYVSSTDYLQWLVADRSSDLPHAASTTPQNSVPHESLDSFTASEDSTDDEPKLAKISRHRMLKRDLPDHLLATFLHTYWLVSSCTFWNIYSNSSSSSEFRPDPLLLVRKTNKEILLGSVIIPKDCNVAVSPVLCSSMLNNSSPGIPRPRRTSTTTELTLLSAMTSVQDLPYPMEAADSFSRRGSQADIHQSPSTTSFSPLLNDKRQSFVDSCATSDKQFKGHEYSHKSRKGSWVRRYPQGHLISLMVGTISNHLSSWLNITETEDLRIIYGGAETAWVPFPDKAITVTRSATRLGASPSTLFTHSEPDSRAVHSSGKSEHVGISSAEEI